MNKFLILCMVILSITYAQKSKDIKKFQDYEQVSLRNIASGELLVVNNKFSIWIIDEVQNPGYLNNRFSVGIVQLRIANNPKKCLATNGAGLKARLNQCDELEKGNHSTLFSIIPASNGAIQIQSVSSGLCLIINKNNLSSKTPILGNCELNLTSFVPFENLWALLPPESKK